MQLTECEPTAEGVVMEPPRSDGFLESSCGAGDSAASLDIANESSEEESTGEREEEIGAHNKVASSTRATEVPAEQTSDTQTVNAQRPNSLSVVAAVAAAAAEPGLWTTQGDAEVKLRMGDSGLAAETPLTVNQMFTSAVERFGNYTALSWKEGEQQKSLNYRDYYQTCRIAAKSFLKLGLQRYHGVGILGFNSAEWFIADIGAILAGGFAVGIYTTNSPEACQYVAENCKANIIVVENHKQLQKILQVEDKLPHLKAIIQYKGALKEKRPNLYTWAEFMELGRNEPDAPLDAIISSQKPNQCCTLIYTSGTTGQPKGVMLSHDNLTWTALSTSRHVRLTDATHAQESVVSYLPLSHIAAQMVDIWVTMRVGGATYFAQPDALKMQKDEICGAKSYDRAGKVAAWAKASGLQTNLTKMNKVYYPFLDIPLYTRLCGVSEARTSHHLSLLAFKLTAVVKRFGVQSELPTDEESSGESASGVSRLHGLPPYLEGRRKLWIQRLAALRADQPQQEVRTSHGSHRGCGEEAVPLINPAPC
ncbi:long-chain-fatty-acid--CoA ligase ACSBG2 isoform X1 [Lates japonicus]|uniref:Long-chain-fatty-acid--CoA ligase ACSBG2 n=1 Tax=Lates japonicus TaxID=270547 RepID=A0AAD3M8R5_LATJO|nr:long-chain-fatty-acid--CoA ligase ACSBG2 isoform X1 [Lates japonicus]